MAKCGCCPYPDNTLRNYSSPSWYLSTSSQHAKCLDSFTVPPLFHLPKQKQVNNQSKEADGFYKNRTSFTLNGSLNNSCSQLDIEASAPKFSQMTNSYQLYHLILGYQDNNNWYLGKHTKDFPSSETTLR